MKIAKKNIHKVCYKTKDTAVYLKIYIIYFFFDISTNFQPHLLNISKLLKPKKNVMHMKLIMYAMQNTVVYLS